MLGLAAERDPEVDFELIPAECTIGEIWYSRREEHDTHNNNLSTHHHSQHSQH